MTSVSPANQEAVDAWNGVLFDRFLEYRHIFTAALGQHGTKGMDLHPPPEGGRVLDIGCGFGDTTQELAARVGPSGSAHGIDAADRFIEKSIEEAEEAGVSNVSFQVGDVETAEIDGPFDHAFARMGTMFFANPVAALRNVRQALVPGATLCQVVWRQKIENPVMYEAEQIVEGFIGHPDKDESDEPTCGPGPFSMANADTVSEQLIAAGFSDIGFYRSDIEIRQGTTLDEATDVVMALGPAGELLRLAGDDADRLEAEIGAEIRKMLSAYEREDGEVWVPTSCWIVSARA